MINRATVIALLVAVGLALAPVVVDSKCVKPSPPSHHRHPPSRRLPPRPRQQMPTPAPHVLASPPPKSGPGPYTTVLMQLRSELSANSIADSVLTDWTNNTDPCAPPGWQRVACNGTAAPTLLDLSKIELSGDLPSTLWTLTSLTSLDVGTNFIGAVPDSVSNLTRLRALDLSSNSIPELPSSLYQLLSLRTLSVTSNAFSGAFPSEVSSLTELEDLQVQRNGWSGAFPPSLVDLVKLTKLDISFSNIDGTLPQQMSALSNLQAFGFQKLLPRGEPQAMPTVVTSWKKLADLALSGNNFNGSALPPIYSSLTGLQNLTLYNMRVGGSLPSGWSALVKLSVLDLHSNALTGTLPQPWCSLDATLLNSRLSVANNSLTGALPLCPVWLSADTRGNDLIRFG